MGETIAEQRKNRSMTQKELAEQMNMTQMEIAPDNEFKKAIDVALRAIPMAMGIAVVVGGLLGKLDPAWALNLLGVGMFCLALKGLQKE